MTTNGALNGHTNNFIPNNETDTTSLISSSSSSSLSSFSSLHSMSFPENISSTPTTPLRFSGIPFSWEKLPGIPKHQMPNKNDHQNFLPLPPAGNTPRKSGRRENSVPTKKPNCGDSFRKDPFFAAFVECSKDEDESLSNFWKGSKVARSFSDRLGFVNVIFTSCKNASAVSDSLVYLPRSNRRSGSGQHR